MSNELGQLQFFFLYQLFRTPLIWELGISTLPVHESKSITTLNTLRNTKCQKLWIFTAAKIISMEKLNFQIIEADLPLTNFLSQETCPSAFDKTEWFPVRVVYGASCHHSHTQPWCQLGQICAQLSVCLKLPSQLVHTSGEACRPHGGTQTTSLILWIEKLSVEYTAETNFWYYNIFKV